jgi:hypothetical protein
VIPRRSRLIAVTWPPKPLPMTRTVVVSTPAG